MRFDFYQTLRQVPIGVFMETKEFILFSLPLFFFVLFGLKKPWLQGKQCLYLPFASVAIAFPVFALPFYQRIFVFTDIALIIVAAFGLEEMLIIGKHAMSKTRALMSYSIIGIALVWWWGNTLHQITTLNPTPSQMFRGELDTGFNVIPPEATVITSTTLAPWVHGWTHNNVIAPGLLGDPHTIQQWTLFWNGDLETKKTFLNTFPRPLYFVVESQQKEVLLKGLRPCMGQKTPFVFMHNC